jgi:hypothetical protein
MTERILRLVRVARTNGVHGDVSPRDSSEIAAIAT